MGFYATDTYPKVANLSNHRNDLPLKKSRLDFFSSSGSRAGFSALQPVEAHRENEATPTKTVSGHLRHYEYSPFGETLVATGPLAGDNPFRFSTKYWDDETGKGDWDYRLYDPVTGRFMSKDLAAEEGGLNLYAFVDNNAIGYVDTDGNNKYPASDRLIVTPAQPKILPGEPNGKNDDGYDWGESGVECDGYGGVRPKLDRSQFSSQPMVSCVAPCTAAHEQQHADDLLQVNPNVCKGKRPGDPAHFPDRNSEKASEAKAFQKEHNCLNANMENNPCLCQDIGAARIQDRENKYYGH